MKLLRNLLLSMMFVSGAANAACPDAEVLRDLSGDLKVATADFAQLVESVGAEVAGAAGNMMNSLQDFDSYLVEYNPADCQRLFLKVGAIDYSYIEMSQLVRDSEELREKPLIYYAYWQVSKKYAALKIGLVKTTDKTETEKQYCSIIVFDAASS